ncbi:MAG: MBL fold metallo-hydrolase [Methanomassiliicoccaceae archaeon]|jgi:phosphoribosyl 1,2-cyclic phosphodiesterase|nr:MBL fold metallo-hydrolase [Methanomassiliicoccaceae archaeon]
MGTELTFLGTGGGRYATIYQTRSTGGIVLDSGGKRMHIDPGPGALTNMSRIGMYPARTDAILISHCHPDHYSDAEVLIEGMCKGGVSKRGVLAGSVSIMEGHGELGPRLTPYHFKMVERHITARPGDPMNICDMNINITRSLHSDGSAVGFKIHTADGIISYVCDTHCRDDIIDEYKGSRVIILPVTRPTKARIRCHLCTEDAVRFAEAIRPELVLFAHMGVRMIQEGPEKEAAYVESRTGVRTIAAKDLMKVSVSRDITITAAAALSSLDK